MKTIPLLIFLGGTAVAQTTERVQPTTEANTYCSVNSTSSDGRYVAFVSAATNVVIGDTNGTYDVFLRDRQTGTTELVSVNSSGVQGNGPSGYVSNGAFDDFFGVSVSADGRYVAFMSAASNLAVGVGSAPHWGILVRDRQLGTTELASVDSSGVPANYSSAQCSISADGRYVAFESPASNLVPGGSNGNQHIFVHDRQTGTTEQASVDSAGAQGNDISAYPVLSADGRYVAFLSRASNLVLGDTNGFEDVFVHDRQTGTTERVSVDSSGAQGNNSSFELSISGDGRFVAFQSYASNLVPLDTNGFADIFVRDRQSGTTERVSVSSGAVQGNSASNYPSISADGRYVAFESGASTLVAGDTNAKADVFVRDRLTGITQRMSVDSSGAQANGDSGFLDLSSTLHSSLYSLSLSADGRYVSFESGASNLVAGDTNALADVFTHDRQSGTTQRVSVGSGQGNSSSDQCAISADGRCVAIQSYASNLVPGDTNGTYDLFVYDRPSKNLELVTKSWSTPGATPNGASYHPVLSSDGRYVAFESDATDLVPNDTNSARDIFVYDRSSSTTTRASVGIGGVANGASYNASISGDGRYVAFQSDATNLVAFDTNGCSDIFVRDIINGTTERASVAVDGTQGNGFSQYPSISPDGRYVALMSYASNLVAGDTNNDTDMFVHDRQTGSNERVNIATNGMETYGAFGRPSISAGGRFVAFTSLATDLVPGDTNGFYDVFVRDRVAGTTERVSVASNGAQANANSEVEPALSADGRFVAFQSDATNLVAGDTNVTADEFVHDRLTGTTERVNLSVDGTQANQYSDVPSMSSDGRFVAFASFATSLVAGDTNNADDIFVRDRGATSAFSSFCFGDGTGAACPCANNGNAGHGCQNSAATGGAVLTATGGASLSLDAVTLTSSSELSTATSVVLQGISAVSPAIFGDGLRCAGGTLKRLYTKHAVGGVMTAPQMGDASISARSSALGDTIPLGSTRIYQVYYRDPNFAFCPGGFNVTNAIAIAWGA